MQDYNDFDVIIVGAGPAGAACAYMLGQAGIKVVLLDKATFPRDKTCGDALSLDVVQQLKRMSVSLFDQFEKRTEKQKAWGVTMVAPNGNTLDLPLYINGSPTHGYVCTRMVFDQFMVDAASSWPSVTLMQDTAVLNVAITAESAEVSTHKGIFRAPLIIGADGAHSIVNRSTINRKINRKNHSAGLRQYYSGVTGFNEGSHIELHFFKEALPGYLWIFPLPNQMANVGIGMLSSAVQAQKVDLKKTMNRLIHEHPNLKNRFSTAQALEDVKGYGLPLGAKPVSRSGNRFMLIGDAAAIIDPFSGEGIANAIRTGRVAAEQALKSLDLQQFDAATLKAYDQRIQKLLRKEMLISYRLLQMSKYPLFLNIIISLANKSQYFKKHFVSALAQVNERNVLRLPMLMLKSVFKRNITA